MRRRGRRLRGKPRFTVRATKLVTWNVQWCRGMDGKVAPGRILHEARAFADFDVLCLQEVAANFAELEGSRGEDQVQELARSLPGYSVHFATATDVDDGSGGRRLFGNLIASRLPVLQVFRHALPWPADPAVPSMARVALEAVLAAPWGPIRVITTHLEYYSGKIRLSQVEALRSLHTESCAHARQPRISGDPGDPFEARPRPASAVACGDFNFSPTDPGYARLTGAFESGLPRLVDAWRVVHSPMPHTPTFRVHDPEANEPPYCCDFVFVTEDLAPKLRSIEVNPTTEASDHQPVMIEIA
ncbi:MAG: endonuclease/exonuclease/phosphatase family protein [Burkholderiales bacterium]